MCETCLRKLYLGYLYSDSQWGYRYLALGDVPRAQKDGIEPLVISKTMGVEPYNWRNKVLIPYPKGLQIKGFGRAYKLQQKMTGWGHIHQKAYNVWVAEAIQDNKAESLPIVLHNDPELSVFLREQFPNARIVSHFYNHNPCSEKFRVKFGGAAAPTLSTAVSNFTARWVERYYGLSAGSVLTLYNGVDCERFCPAQTQTLDNGPPVVNFVGRTSVDKDPDLLLKAALRLAERTKNFSLQLLRSTFWGGGAPDSVTQELDRLTTELQAAGIAVRMPGFIGRWALPEELRKAHIHVVPSRWDEPFALSTLEGMATGLATIASATGGTPEAVSGAGLMFEKDDLDALTEELTVLVTEPDQRIRYASLARERAQYFTWEKIWIKLRELVDV